MSAPPRETRLARDSLSLLAGLLVGAAFAPLLAIVDLFRRARVRVLRGRSRWTNVRSLALEDGALVVGLPRDRSSSTVERIALDEIVAVRTWQVTGDAGFADTNTETFLVWVVLRDGTARGLVHREPYPHPFASVVLPPLRSRGLALPTKVIEGPVRGFGAGVIHGLALLWCAAALAFFPWGR